MGPTTRTRTKKSKRLVAEATRLTALRTAWAVIRRNAESSNSKETTAEAAEFAKNSERNLQRLQREVRRGTFSFDKQHGIAIRRPGKDSRPVVVAPVRSRILQRAILDVLQRQPALKPFIHTPTSFGGIKDCGREDAISIAQAAIGNGAKFYVRSDIKAFFTRVQRTEVLGKIAAVVPDEEFARFVAEATKTELKNLARLGDDARLFPDDATGVPQGSCLSPLLANIYLADFDRKLNGRGVTCLRYLDDFLLLAPSKRSADAAFESAQRELQALGLEAYDPSTSPGKADSGAVDHGIDFLGCIVHPDRTEPNRRARERLIEKATMLLDEGRKSMREAAKRGGRDAATSELQTLATLANLIAGWSHSFAFCHAPSIAGDLDARIDKAVDDFLRFSSALRMRADSKARRRLLGVTLVRDVWELRAERQREAAAATASRCAADR